MNGSSRARIRHFATVDSTNERALAWAAGGAPDGSIITADEQTAGRGRRGRLWHSPEGGLYLSYIVRDIQHLPRPSLLTLAAGVATVRAIAGATGLAVCLKWPNDIMTPDAPLKLAGILAEGSSVGSQLEFVVIGIGVNVSLASVPQDLAVTATSLERELGRCVDRSALHDALIAALDGEIARLRRGDHETMLSEWMARAPGSRGARISWRAHDGDHVGVTAGIDGDGALLVRGVGEGTERGDGAPRVTEPGGVQGSPPQDDGLQRLVAGEVIWT